MSFILQLKDEMGEVLDEMFSWIWSGFALCLEERVLSDVGAAEGRCFDRSFACSISGEHRKCGAEFPLKRESTPSS